MAGRPKHYSQNELIDRAMEAFWLKGYSATSAQDLMKAMKIGQGSFYLNFKGGKKELYQKSLLRFSETRIKKFDKSIKASENPLLLIKQLFTDLANSTTDIKENGCYLGNALVELSNHDNDTKNLSADLLLHFKQVFEEGLLISKKKGLLKTSQSPQILASHLLNLWNGISVTLRIPHDKKEIKQVIEMNLQCLL